MSLPFKPNDRILFTGDSITDADRNRECPPADPAVLGVGYARVLAGKLGFNHAELQLHFRNTGINGNRTSDLLARWSADCIAIQPNWISLLIGINNTWQRYTANHPTSPALFETESRELLDRIKNETPARIILCSPFLLHIDAPIARMREDLDPKIKILKNLAAEFDAIWVDFDTAFTAATQRQPPAYWAIDGVHPTVAGHALMAHTWLKAITTGDV